MRTAICQFAAGLDTDDNLRICTELVERAAASGAELAILPEAAMYYDPHHEGPSDGTGQSIDGPFVTALAGTARTAGIAILAGMSETLPGGDGRSSNTLVALSARGELHGVYRKLHLYDAFGYRESDRVRPGQIEQPLVFDVGDMRVGALTCYDLRFPEAFRWVVDAGADAVLLPAAWAAGPMKEDHWRTLLAARAIENTAYIAAAGQTGPVSCGQSMIVDPMGVTISCAGDEPGVAFAELRPDRVASVREINPSLTNRRFQIVAR